MLDILTLTVNNNTKTSLPFLTKLVIIILAEKVGAAPKPIAESQDFKSRSGTRQSFSNMCILYAS